MSTAAAHTEPEPAGGQDRAELAPADIEALFPADPDLMVSPEGDRRGLQEVQEAARARRETLAQNEERRA